MGIFEFMSDSPFLTFFIAFFIAFFIYHLLRYVFFCLPNRMIRSRNIKNKGWPPPYLDADGDHVEPDKVDG